MAGLSVTADLASYLRAGGSRAFAWGEHDCCRFALGWVARRRGVDPGARWLGRYRTARGAALHLRRGGGLLAVATVAFAEAGLVATDAPAIGDVGIVMAGQGETLAIRTATGWACAAVTGIGVAQFAAVKAWSV